MRITVEKRLELTDHGVTERRVEIEMTGDEIARTPEAVLVVEKIMAALERESEQRVALVA